MLSFNDLISVFSKPGLLPLSKSFELTGDNTMQDTLRKKKPFVLIFGTDADVCFMLKTILEIWNYDYKETSTVEQSFQIAENITPDLVLMDTDLAFSDSFSKMRKMRKNELFQGVPFVLLSGHAQEDIRLMALAAGAADFFVKPVNLDLLEDTLKSRLSHADRINGLKDFKQ